MKRFTLKVLDIMSIFWKILPSKIRLLLFTFFLILESRGSRPNEGLKRLFNIKDKLEWIINERALKSGHGIHLKHKLINYHAFFIDNIQDGEKVLDVGCGYGAVAKSIALARPLSDVTGIDNNPINIQKANSFRNIKNLKFIHHDANSDDFSIESDVIILSNVLEHIESRTEFLARLKKVTNARKILIRVPLFERDWQLPLRKELNVNYYSDADHKIEHTLDEFIDELKIANIKIISLSTKWGEIWAKCSYE